MNNKRKNMIKIIILGLINLLILDLNAQNITKIPFQQTNSGIMNVKVTINNSTRTFIFDTGASGLVINQATFNSLRQNGSVGSSDIIGKTQTVIADGSIADAIIIRLRSITIGGFLMNNIDAFVMPGGNAPLLLGQNVFSKFGKITIDYNNKVIELVHSSTTPISTNLQLKELRIIPCKISKISEVLPLTNLFSSKLQVTSITEEKNVPPPQKAVNRIHGDICIRYFDNKDYKVALKIKEELSSNNKYNGADIKVENMLPYYNYKSIPSYIEIWLK